MQISFDLLTEQIKSFGPGVCEPCDVKYTDFNSERRGLFRKRILFQYLNILVSVSDLN